MKKNIKKAAAIALAALSLTSSVSTSVYAYGITGSSFYYTNSADKNIYSIAKNSTVYAQGSVTYDASFWGWVPVPSTCYYYMETPYGSLNKPSSITGSWTSATFTYVGYSDMTENSVYRMNKSFGLVYSATKNVKALTSSKSYSTNWYTGGVGTGTGHDSDGSSLADFKTN